MQKQRQQVTREAQAHAEAGTTVIGRGSVWTLCLCFLVLTGLVLGIDVGRWILALMPQTENGIAVARPDAPRRRGSGDRSDCGTLLQRLVEGNRRLQLRFQAVEDFIEDESVIGQRLRPHLQLAFAAHLGVGNAQVNIGRSGWLFYAPDVTTVTAPGFLCPDRLRQRLQAVAEWRALPHPDPRAAIRDLHASLKARGITLVLLPTPLKTTTDSQRFAGRGMPSRSMPRNVDFYRWMSEMREEGIRVFDAVEVLGALDPAEWTEFALATDTHWRPETMRTIAEALAARLHDWIEWPATPDPGWRRRAETVTGCGDLVHMLDLPENQRRFPPETVTIEPVVDADNQFWRPDSDADILLLGDSFSNLYAFEPMGWGEGAGFAEQLSMALRRPVDRIVRNDDGAWATRSMLAAELARGIDRLDGKRVVIWQFAERELVHGDWRPIDLRLGTPTPSRFVLPAPGQTLTVHGIVQAVAPAPRPGTVPYLDHLVAVHLVDLEHDDPSISGGQALLYLQSMLDNVWTRAARLRRGEAVTLRLSPWESVAERLETVNRAELDDWDLQLEPHAWGELE